MSRLPMALFVILCNVYVLSGAFLTIGINTILNKIEQAFDLIAVSLIMMQRKFLMASVILSCVAIRHMSVFRNITFIPCYLITVRFSVFSKWSFHLRG